MADRLGTRGDVAYKIYQALGISQPSSTDHFDDGGYLAGVASTLKDLGITEGIGGRQFGTMNNITRGEAFTLLARALKLVPPGTDIGTASEALRQAGIIQGYANGDLGLNDTITTGQIDLIMNRAAPLWDQPPPGGDATGGSVRDTHEQAGQAIRDEGLARRDPTFAAYLQAAGVRQAQIEDEMETRADLFGQATGRRSEQYAKQAEDARRGINMDFENRGFYRSGTREDRALSSDEAIEQARRHQQAAAAESYGNVNRDLGYQYNQNIADTAIQAAQAGYREDEYQIGQGFV